VRRASSSVRGSSRLPDPLGGTTTILEAVGFGFGAGRGAAVTGASVAATTPIASSLKQKWSIQDPVDVELMGIVGVN
jgi:hypothetical protein